METIMMLLKPFLYTNLHCKYVQQDVGGIFTVAPGLDTGAHS